jgi:hypothetical protein
MSQVHTLGRTYRRYHVNDYAASSASPTPAWYSLIAWFRATDLVLADGGPVTSWPSSVGTIVASAGSAPAYKVSAGPGSKPSVLWNADNLTISPTLNLTTAAWTVAAVVQSNGDGHVLGHSSINYQMRKYRSSVNNISVYNNSTDIQSSGFATVYNNPVLCWWVYNASVISFYENQTARGGAGWSTFGSNLDKLGATSYGGNWAGYMSEICVWNVAFSLTQISQLYTAYFSPRYGNVF